MKHVYSIPLLFALAGCNNNAAEYDIIHVNKNIVEAIPIEHFLSDYQFIELEATDSALVGAPQKVALMNGVFFISDGSRLFQFTMEGKHLRTLDKKGRGPQEYLSIWDFTVTDKEILIWDQNSRKFFRFSLDDTFINSYTIDNYAATIYPIDNDKVLFSSAYQEKDEFKYLIRDLETMDKISSFYPINEAEISYRHFMNQNNFSEYRGALLFHEPMNNYIYEIRNQEVRPIHYFDIYGQNPPEAFWKSKYEHIMDISMTASKNGYCYGIPLYAEGDNQIVFSFRYDNKYMICCFLKEQKESVQSENVILHQDVPAVTVAHINTYATSGDFFLFTVAGDSFFDSYGMPFSEELSHISNNGNPVICLAKLK